MPDRRLLELEDHINFLLKGSSPTPRPSLTHVPQAYVEAVSSNLHPRNKSEPPTQNPFTFREHTSPYPQPQALGTTFGARLQDYMAAHTEIMERLENAIFKQRKEINDRMIEMFGLLKELTASQTPEKVLVREEARHSITKNVNYIFVIQVEEEKNVVNNGAIGESIVEPRKSEEEKPLKEVDEMNEVDDKLAKSVRENVTKNEEEGSA
ncbi:hypothetical protein Tco_1564549 [Tanacetum coccineum]